MKLHRLMLKCFRGFPFEETLVFHGKNVLLYGENGSGKSTLFHALREALPRTRNRRRISRFANTFIEPPGTPPPSTAKVELEFRPVAAPDDPAQARTVLWEEATASRCNDWEFQVARRLMALDYRSVLETHYVQRFSEDLNIYSLLAKTILGSAENPTVAGSFRPIFREQWQGMIDESQHRLRRGSRRLRWLNSHIDSMHKGLKGIEPKLVPLANEYLARLSTGLTVGIDLKDAPYYDDNVWEKRLTSEGKAFVTADFFGQPVRQPATFFNEARLSAVALALYLAGVRLSLPDKNQEPTPYPRVLVLDDVLIGLDLSHRLPLLELLAEKFADWQVLLFTHDRAWFELAQVAMVGEVPWLSIEMRAKPMQHGTQVMEAPLVRPGVEKLAEHYLKLADEFRVAGEDRTAALHARAAFEVKLKGYCSRKRIQVAYDLDGRHLTTDQFLDAIERRLSWDGKLPKALFTIQRVKLFRHGVLNPLAHFHPVTIYSGEVERAIEAVGALNFPEGSTDFTAETGRALAKATLPPKELIDAACWLRTAFEVDLRLLLIRLRGVVAFRRDWTDVSIGELWTAAQDAMTNINSGPAGTLISSLQAYSRVFLDPWRFDLVTALAKSDLDAAWAALLDPLSSGSVHRTRLATFV